MSVSVSISKPIHPFPARMAADIALEELASFAPGSLILDPMAGSGTVLRAAAEQGHRGLGFDLDPLAVLMAKVWTTPVEPEELRGAARSLATRIGSVRQDISLPWIDEDSETSQFIEYWFGDRQRSDLRNIAHLLQDVEGPVGDALRIAFSRIIITKDRGASLARDVSHSRPHRVRDDNDFEVVPQFVRSADRLSKLLGEKPLSGSSVEVRLGDARDLPGAEASLADAVITSPPYLNAIDYIRGHRMSLVWLGYRVDELRDIRARSIGSERAPQPGADLALAELLVSSLGPLESLPNDVRRMIDRYVLDLLGMMSELRRVLRSGGKAILVIGNSTLRGVFVRNAEVVAAIAERIGFEPVRETEHELPPSRRYLPPPRGAGYSSLERRMRTETLLSYMRP